MPLSKELQLYLAEAANLKKAGPGGCSAWDLLRFYREWRRSQHPDANPLRDRRPWLTFSATRFLQRHLRSTMQVFEYGAGGSTLFFAARVANVVSVEHDSAWAAQVQAALVQEQRLNATVHLIPPESDPACDGQDPADPEAYVSSAPQYRGMSFRKYAAHLDGWPDASFDLVMVDGRARPGCLCHARSKVKPGGWLLLDNAERAHYHPALRSLEAEGWRKRDFSGPGPRVAMFWRTWIWQRPNAKP